VNEKSETRTEAPRVTEGFAFFRGFLRNPEQVGSIIPSSRFLEKRIIQAADLDNARVIVELGPGTGGTTRAFLRAMGDQARLLNIELDEVFIPLLDEIGDYRLTNHAGSAEHIGEILGHYGLPHPDAVISGIPFSTMPWSKGEAIIKAIWSTLVPGGRFVAYQFRAQVADIASSLLGKPDVKFELCNIPPMRVYRWQKPLNGNTYSM
jgi:phosphatidylethanolamine/phosphatidyl-N-methylethanolamine N-methyltransferase